MDEEVKETPEVEGIEQNDTQPEEVQQPVQQPAQDPRIDTVIERLQALEESINEIVVPIRNMSQRDIPPAATSEQARPARRYI